MELVFCLLLVFVTRVELQVIDVDCLTADGTVGRCTEASKCMTSYHQVNTVLCRYSRGYGTRICCPRSSIRTHSSYTSVGDREDSYGSNQPLAFPGEAAYSGYDSYSQQTTNTYNYNPSLSENSDYRPYNNRPSHNKPQYHEKPSYSSESSSYYERPQYSSSSSNFDQRPSYSSSSGGYQERPSYSSGSNGYQERPSYSSESSSYEERPTYSSSGGGSEYNERPSYSSSGTGYNERPNYSNSGSGYNERPSYSNSGSGYNERPSYSNSGSGYNERPSYSSNSNGYQEKPNYSGGSNGYQGRPNYSSGTQESSNTSWRPDKNRPRPGSNYNSRETTTSWEFPTSGSNRRTTPRPSWAVENNSSGSSSGSSSSSRKRISEQKCEEYSQPVSQTINALPLSIDTEAVPLKVQNCDFSAVKLIVGGEASELGEFPHMAAVGYKVRTSRNVLWNCGGTLISERYILTAGHCVNTSFGNPVVVRLGEYNIERDNDGAEPEDYAVQRVIVHPSYHKTLKYNDIALLRLDRAVQFNKFVRPACLPTDNNIRGRPTATGWGRTDFVGKQSEILMKVALSVIDNRQCNTYYNTNNPGSSSFASGIVDTMLCAGYVEGGRDTCLGDSGGPLTITKKENPCIHYVVGITSFGKICAAPKSPGVYTRVVKYLDWIEKTVWP